MFMEVWTMANEKKWQLDLGEYIRQGEPAQAEKSESWQIAIGLQQVDGLETSDYLLATAKDHIEGKIDIKEAQRRIVSYYEAADQRQYFENDTAEADIVSSRITELLGENTFQFSSVEFQNIHKRLFTGIIDHAGMWRTYNISKAEWVLNGKSVVYAPWQSIRDTLDYDFEKERVFSYGSLTLEEIIQHLASFTSGIWQIHPFCEGNTRTTAVFILKYMKTFGLSIDNEAFKNHSWYFRNALVRANYNDLQNNVHATTNYLEHFFENLLLGTNHELKNRYLHIDFDDWQQSTDAQSATDHIHTILLLIIVVIFHFLWPTTQNMFFFLDIFTSTKPADIITFLTSSAFNGSMFGIIFSQCLFGSPGSLITANLPFIFSVRYTSIKHFSKSRQK